MSVTDRIAVTDPQSPGFIRFDPPLTLALVVSDVQPQPHEDDAGLIAALGEHGIHAQPRIWSDPAVDWAGHDALLVRSTWDYFQRYTEFLQWYQRIDALRCPIANPLPLLVWNSDKRYLLDLAAQGVAIVATVHARGGELDAALAPMQGEVVVKPSVSGGAWHTVRGRIGDAAFAQALAALPRELDYLVQPFLPQVVEDGEWSLLFFGGVYSHAVLKKPAQGDYRVQTYFGGSADLSEPPAPLSVDSILARTGIQAVMSDSHQQLLFSYGTLQLPAVQQATFGRLLHGEPDALVGFRRTMVKIDDPQVVATSGETHHPIVAASGDAADRVAGTVFAISAAELAHADAYEVDDYRRVEAELASGRRAWVYVRA